MGRSKQKRVDRSNQNDVAPDRSEVMRENTHKKRKTLNAHNELLGLIYNFLKQHGYDKSARKLRSEDNKLVGNGTVKEALWENISADYPSLISIFLQWEKDHQIDRNKADTILEISESSSESDASSENMSSEESSLLTPSVSSSSSEHNNSLSDFGLELISKKRKRISRSASCNGNATSSSSPSTSSLSEDDSDTSSQRPVKRPKRSGIIREQDYDSSSAGTNSIDSNPSLSSRKSTSERDYEDASATGSSSDSSQISDVSESKAVLSRSSSSDSPSEQSSPENDPNKEEIPRIINLRPASSSATVKANSKNINSDEKPKSTKTLKPKIEDSAQRRKNSTDSSNTLIGGEEGKSIDTKIAVKYTEKSPSPTAKERIGKGQIPHKRQKTDNEVISVKQPRRDNSPFSRIPKDIKVDGHFAANLYMPNAANEQVYQDLRLTKGKGFTKEKNKKKRGSRFSGGKIDIHARETLKFVD